MMTTRTLSSAEEEEECEEQSESEEEEECEEQSGCEVRIHALFLFLTLCYYNYLYK